MINEEFVQVQKYYSYKQPFKIFYVNEELVSIGHNLILNYQKQEQYHRLASVLSFFQYGYFINIDLDHISINEIIFYIPNILGCLIKNNLVFMQLESSILIHDMMSKLESQSIQFDSVIVKLLYFIDIIIVLLVNGSLIFIKVELQGSGDLIIDTTDQKIYDYSLQITYKNQQIDNTDNCIDCCLINKFLIILFENGVRMMHITDLILSLQDQENNAEFVLLQDSIQNNFLTSGQIMTESLIVGGTNKNIFALVLQSQPNILIKSDIVVSQLTKQNVLIKMQHQTVFTLNGSIFTLSNNKINAFSQLQYDESVDMLQQIQTSAFAIQCYKSTRNDFLIDQIKGFTIFQSMNVVFYQKSIEIFNDGIFGFILDDFTYLYQNIIQINDKIYKISFEVLTEVPEIKIDLIHILRSIDQLFAQLETIKVESVPGNRNMLTIQTGELVNQFFANDIIKLFVFQSQIFACSVGAVYIMTYNSFDEIYQGNFQLYESDNHLYLISTGADLHQFQGGQFIRLGIRGEGHQLDTNIYAHQIDHQLCLSQMDASVQGRWQYDVSISRKQFRRLSARTVVVNNYIMRFNDDSMFVMQQYKMPSTERSIAIEGRDAVLRCGSYTVSKTELDISIKQLHSEGRVLLMNADLQLVLVEEIDDVLMVTKLRLPQMIPSAFYIAESSGGLDVFIGCKTGEILQVRLSQMRNLTDIKFISTDSDFAVHLSVVGGMLYCLSVLGSIRSYSLQ